MYIVAVGVDHTTAPIPLRERLACSGQQVAQVLAALQQTTQECVLLSTCNRLEAYALCVDAHAGKADIVRALAEVRQVEQKELTEHCYTLIDEQAMSHLFGVTCGLHSLVPGEPQIQGQVADALEIALAERHAGPILSALFRAALVTGKRARSETGISRSAVSISHVAVQLARRLFPTLYQANILLVGSGEMSELAARNLRDNGAQRLVIVNRTSEHAIQLAEALGATHRAFTELSNALTEADVVISSTKAPRALITTQLMQRVMEQRAQRPLLIIDIAMPRDVEQNVSLLPGVHLYNLDDLQTEVTKGLELRQQEIGHVQAIIAEEGKAFQRWLASLDAVGTIRALRQRMDVLREQELERAMRQLAPTLSEREAAAVRELTMRLMNKVLHTPTMRLKDAAAAGAGSFYADALQYLFDLEEKHEANYSRDTSQQARHDTDELGCNTTSSTVARS